MTTTQRAFQLAPYPRITAAGCEVIFKYQDSSASYRLELTHRNGSLKGSVIGSAVVARVGRYRLADAAARAKAGRFGPTSEIHAALLALADAAEMHGRGA